MPTIDVPVQTPVNQYTANPSQTVFAYTFLLFSDADVQVIVDGVTKTLTTDYTVSGVLNEAGGNITFGTGLTGGESVTIKRKTSIGRDSQYQADGTFDAAPLERDLDKLTTIAQELRRDVDAAVRLNTADLTSSNELPLPSANKALVWSGSSPYSLVNGPTTTDIANAATNAATATTKAAEATASASAASTSESNAAASAAAAASSAAEGLYNDVITITNADSPYVPSLAQEGTLFRCDTSSGNIVISLSALSTYGEDMKFAFVKTTGDANTVTINRGGSDTIDAGTSTTVSDQFVVTVLVGDSATSAWVKVLHNAVIADSSITTAKLADNAVTLAKLEDGTQGDILYYGASGAPARLGVGTSGQFLKTQGAGANPVWADNTPGYIQTSSATYATYGSTTAVVPQDDTIPQNTEGTELLTASITPTNAANKLIITAQVPHWLSAGINFGIMSLFQDSTANALATVHTSEYNAGMGSIMTLTHTMAAGTVSATTFKIRVGTTAGTFYYNGNASARLYGGVFACRLTVMEVAA